MKQRRRICSSESQKAQMWERWRAGDDLHQIAILFDRPQTSVLGILVRTDGIQPARGHRSSIALTFVEREEISRSVTVSVEFQKYRRVVTRSASYRWRNAIKLKGRGIKFIGKPIQ